MPRYNWSGVNWELSNLHIAALLGCTSEAVAYQRRKWEARGNWIEGAILDARVGNWIDKLPAGTEFSEADIAPAILWLEVEDALHDMLELGVLMLLGWQDGEMVMAKVEQAEDPLVW